MRARGKVLPCLLISLFSVLIIVKNTSPAAMSAYEVCALRQWEITSGSGDELDTSSGYYWDCMTFYFYYAPNGGNGGGPGGSGEGDDPGGGSGGRTIFPDYDTDREC